MARNEHIEKDIFKLFLSSGAYLEYAKKFLKPKQIDTIQIEKYLN